MRTTLTRNVVGVAVFLGLWEGFGHSGIVLKQFFPPLSTVLATLARQLVTPEFLRDLIATVLAWLIAVGIAVAIAGPAGLLLGTIRWLRRAALAYIEFLRPIPAIAWWPVAFIILDGDPQTKIALAVTAAIWPILVNIIYAIGEIDPLYIDTARTLGMTPLRIATWIRLPDLLPFALTGIRISVTFALLVVVSTELVFGGIAGLGTYVISHGAETGQMDIVLAAALVVGGLGYLSNSALTALQKRCLIWAPGEPR